jgi:hypothetical protein
MGTVKSLLSNSHFSVPVYPSHNSLISTIENQLFGVIESNAVTGEVKVRIPQYHEWRIVQKGKFHLISLPVLNAPIASLSLKWTCFQSKLMFQHLLNHLIQLEHVYLPGIIHSSMLLLEVTKGETPFPSIEFSMELNLSHPIIQQAMPGDYFRIICENPVEGEELIIRNFSAKLSPVEHGVSMVARPPIESFFQFSENKLPSLTIGNSQTIHLTGENIRKPWLHSPYLISPISSIEILVEFDFLPVHESAVPSFSLNLLRCLSPQKVRGFHLLTNSPIQFPPNLRLGSNKVHFLICDDLSDPDGMSGDSKKNKKRKSRKKTDEPQQVTANGFFDPFHHGEYYELRAAFDPELGSFVLRRAFLSISFQPIDPPKPSASTNPKTAMLRHLVEGGHLHNEVMERYPLLTEDYHAHRLPGHAICLEAAELVPSPQEPAHPR